MKQRENLLIVFLSLVMALSMTCTAAFADEGTAAGIVEGGTAEALGQTGGEVTGLTGEEAAGPAEDGVIGPTHEELPDLTAAAVEPVSENGVDSLWAGGELTGEGLLALADETGVITLDADVTLTGTLSVEGGAWTIDGQGYTIARDEGWTGPGPMVETASDGTLTLKNVTLYEGAPQKGPDDQFAVRILEGGALVLEEGSMVTGGGAGAVLVQGGGLVMKEGAEIFDNIGTGVDVGAGARFEMTGGSISYNSGAGVYVHDGGKFVMSGGTITGNMGGGVCLDGGGADISGGLVHMNQGAQVSVLGARADDSTGAVYLTSGRVHTSFGSLTLEGNEGAGFGNAKVDAAGRISELAAKACQDEGAQTYAARGSALWFKPAGDTLRFTVSPGEEVNRNDLLKAAYLPLNGDGTPEEGAGLTVAEVDNGEPVEVILSGLTPQKAYALMWIQPNDESGAIQLTGKNVEEIRGQTEPYQVEYTLLYRPRGLYSMIRAGDTFTAAVTLDSRLACGTDTVELVSDSSCCELDSEPVFDGNTLTVRFRAVQDFRVDSFAAVAFKGTFDGKIFDEGAEALSSTAALEIHLAEGRKIDLTTVVPCTTGLVPLARHRVDFDAGDGLEVEPQRVKEGEKIVRPTDPTRDGYTFDGWWLGERKWDFENGVVNIDFTLTGRWTENPAEPTQPEKPSEPPEPTQPDTPKEPDEPVEPAAPVETGGYVAGVGSGKTVEVEDTDPPLAEGEDPERVEHHAYIFGYPDGTVRPEESMTRAEAATVFFRLMGEEVRAGDRADSMDFPDVEPGAWYYDALSAAANAGMIGGYADGTVRPNGVVTRGEFVAMAVRYMEPEAAGEGVSDFADTVGHWAAGEIRRAVQAGWITEEGGRFRPDEPITRAEVMALVNRMLGRRADLEYMARDGTGIRDWPDNPPDSPFYADVLEATNSHICELDPEDAGETWIGPAGEGPTEIPPSTERGR